MRRPGSPHQETHARRDVHGGRRHGGPAAAHRCAGERPGERQHDRLQARAPRLPRPRCTRATGPGAARGVRAGAGAAATEVGRGTAQGALQRTERPLDVAIEGPGFLEVRATDGRRLLTRDGALQRDARRPPAHHHRRLHRRPDPARAERRPGHDRARRLGHAPAPPRSAAAPRRPSAPPSGLQARATTSSCRPRRSGAPARRRQRHDRAPGRARGLQRRRWPTR